MKLNGWANDFGECPKNDEPGLYTNPGSSINPMAGSYLNLKFAVCVVPSSSFTISCRHVPAQVFSVFQT